MSELNHIADEAIDLLNSIRIDFEKLQERKRELYPLLPDAQFARLLGVAPTTYSDYKNKKAATPSLKVGLKAALILRFDLRELVPEAGEIENFFARRLR